MKVLYVDAVILGCIIQIILIGSSHGLPNARNCSTITCGYNEQCEEFDDHIASCTCSTNSVRNNSTDKCELKYQWVKYDINQLMNDKRLVINRKFSEGVCAIGRVVYFNKDIHPCEAVMHYNKDPATIMAHYYSGIAKFEVLLAEPGFYKWVKSSNGKVEENAFEGGINGTETVYVCRVRQNNYFASGMMQPSTRSCYVYIYLKSFHDNYDLLTYVN